MSSSTQIFFDFEEQFGFDEKEEDDFVLEGFDSKSTSSSSFDLSRDDSSYEDKLGKSTSDMSLLVLPSSSTSSSTTATSTSTSTTSSSSIPTSKTSPSIMQTSTPSSCSSALKDKGKGKNKKKPKGSTSRVSLKPSSSSTSKKQNSSSGSGNSSSGSSRSRSNRANSSVVWGSSTTTGSSSMEDEQSPRDASLSSPGRASTTTPPPSPSSTSSSSGSASSTSSKSSPSSSERKKRQDKFMAAVASRTMILPLLPKLADRDNYRELYAGLSIFCDRKYALQKVIRELFTKDLEQFPDNLLLREETHCTRLVAGFLHVYATRSLNSIFKKEISLIASKNAVKLTEGPKQVALFNDILKRVASFKKKLLYPVMKVLLLLSQVLSEVRKEELPTSFRRICCSLLFLRFVCPFLVSKVTCVFPAADETLLPKIKQGYLAVIKMLQCMASGTLLDAGIANSALLNQAIEKKTKALHSATDDLFKFSLTLKIATGRLSSPLGSPAAPDISGCVTLKKIISLTQSFFDFLAQEITVIEPFVAEEFRATFIDTAQDIQKITTSPRNVISLLQFQSSELLWIQRAFK